MHPAFLAKLPPRVPQLTAMAGKLPGLLARYWGKYRVKCWPAGGRRDLGRDGWTCGRTPAPPPND